MKKIKNFDIDIINLKHFDIKNINKNEPNTLIELIRDRINYEEHNTKICSCKNCKDLKNSEIFENFSKYDGFDMSGYNEIHNLKLLGRFSDIINTDDFSIIVPKFHKGFCSIIKIPDVCGGEMECSVLEKDLSGETTVDILLKTIFHSS